MSTPEGFPGLDSAGRCPTCAGYGGSICKLRTVEPCPDCGGTGRAPAPQAQDGVPPSAASPPRSPEGQDADRIATDLVRQARAGRKRQPIGDTKPCRVCGWAPPSADGFMFHEQHGPVHEDDVAGVIAASVEAGPSRGATAPLAPEGNGDREALIAALPDSEVVDETAKVRIANALLAAGFKRQGEADTRWVVDEALHKTNRDTIADLRAKLAAAQAELIAVETERDEAMRKALGWQERAGHSEREAGRLRERLAALEKGDT